MEKYILYPEHKVHTNFFLEKFEKTINYVSNKRENFDLIATSTQGF